MKEIFVRPAKFKRALHRNGLIIPEEGIHVFEHPYYRRLINDGDLIVSKPRASNKQDKKPKENT